MAEARKSYKEMIGAGSAKERQATVQAVTLRLWFKDGRRSCGFPWAIYSGDEWLDSGVSGKAERLALSFGEQTVTVTGYHLRRLLALIDEGVLPLIQEHNSREADLLRHGQTDGADDQTPIIERIEVGPAGGEGALNLL